MRKCIAVILALSLAACGGGDRSDRARDCDNTVYGIVLAYPDEDLMPRFDNIAAYGNAGLFESLAHLVQTGRVVRTERGFRVIKEASDAR